MSLQTSEFVLLLPPSAYIISRDQTAAMTPPPPYDMWTSGRWTDPVSLRHVGFIFTWSLDFSPVFSLDLWLFSLRCWLLTLFYMTSSHAPPLAVKVTVTGSGLVAFSETKIQKIFLWSIMLLSSQSRHLNRFHMAVTCFKECFTDWQWNGSIVPFL